MNQWMGLAVICLAGWGIADLVMRGCRFVSFAMRKPMPIKRIIFDFKTKPQARHDAAEKAWRKTDGK